MSPSLAFLLFLCAAQAQVSFLNAKTINVGGSWGTFPLADGRTLSGQDLYEDRGISNRYQKYWLNALPAGGQEWQPSWFRDQIRASKGRSIPLFIVFYVIHEVYPNWNDKSNPLPYEVAMSPAKEAAFMAYLDKFTAFVRSDLSDHGEIAIALETEYNISPLKTDVRYAELMTRAVARLRQGVSGLPGVQLKIGVGYLMQRLLDFGVSEFRAALNTSLTWAPLADFFAPSWSHDNAGAYVDNDGTSSFTACVLQRYAKWAKEAFGLLTVNAYSLSPTTDVTTDSLLRSLVEKLQSMSAELYTSGVRGVGSWDVAGSGDTLFNGVQSNGRWSITDKLWTVAWRSLSSQTTDFSATPFSGPSSCTLPVFDGQNIFLDSLAYGWTDWSFSCTTTIGAVDRIFSGAKSISIDPQPFGAFRLFYDPGKYPNPTILAGDVDVIEFMLQTSSSTVPPTRLSIDSNSGVLLSSVLPSIVANTWTKVRVLMSSIEPNNSISVKVLMLKSTSNTNEKYWIDDLKFVLKNVATQPPATTTTTRTTVPQTTPPVTTAALPLTTVGAGNTATTLPLSTAGSSTTLPLTTAGAAGSTAPLTSTLATALSTSAAPVQSTASAAPVQSTASAASTAPFTAAPCAAPVAVELPRFPVKLECCPELQGRRSLRFVINTNFSEFDSVLWLYELAAIRNVADVKVFKICAIRRGSVILDVDGPENVMSPILSDPSGLPNVTSVQDPRNVATSDGLPAAAIAGIVVGGVVLVAAIVFVVLMIHRKRHSSYSSSISSSIQYVPLGNKP